MSSSGLQPAFFIPSSMLSARFICRSAYVRNRDIHVVKTVNQIEYMLKSRNFAQSLALYFYKLSSFSVRITFEDLPVSNTLIARGSTKLASSSSGKQSYRNTSLRSKPMSFASSAHSTLECP